MTTRLPEPILTATALIRAAQADRAEAMARLFGGAFRALTGWIARTVVTPLRDARRMEAEYAQLTRMSDRQLSDIGLSRSGIAHAVVHGRDDAPAAANANKPADARKAA